jgi:16S rRNA (guanine966-N2)-methyltransferase
VTLRVVAGRYKGRRLRAPAGRGTRPTADRVREALFSILGPLEGLDVLDLFAGSGALGIEALSRGAASATFVDSDARAVAAIRDNLDAIGVAGAVHRRDALAFLAATRDRYDLVFLDPPYSSPARMAERLTELLSPALSDAARIVSESDKRNPLPLRLPLEDERTYGDTRIAIHRAG